MSAGSRRRHPARRARMSAAALSLTGFLAVGTAIAGTARTSGDHQTAGATRVAVATARPTTTATRSTVPATTASTSSGTGTASSTSSATTATTVPTTTATTAAPVTSSHAS